MGDEDEDEEEEEEEESSSDDGGFRFAHSITCCSVIWSSTGRVLLMDASHLMLTTKMFLATSGLINYKDSVVCGVWCLCVSAFL